MNISDVDRKKWVAALLRERHSYEVAGRDDRVKMVDEQLKLYGHEKQESNIRRLPPLGRTEKRPTA